MIVRKARTGLAWSLALAYRTQLVYANPLVHVAQQIAFG
jgi:hypothetical protein